MNPDIKKQWVEALRSGEYKQGRNALRTGDDYCCLGVLTDLAVRAGIGSWSKVSFATYSIFEFVETGDLEELKWGGVLPPAVCIWAGIEQTSNPTLTDEGYQATVLNDVDRWDFNKIADAIEAKL